MAAKKIVKKTTSRVTAPGRVIDRLSEEVHEYHLTVTNAITEIVANFSHIQRQVNSLDLQINGEKPERDDAPSMNADIKSLKQSRNSLRRGVQIAWVVITGLSGLIVTLLKPWK